MKSSFCYGKTVKSPAVYVCVKVCVFVFGLLRACLCILRLHGCIPISVSACRCVGHACMCVCVFACMCACACVFGHGLNVLFQGLFLSYIAPFSSLQGFHMMG